MNESDDIFSATLPDVELWKFVDAVNRFGESVGEC